MYQKPLRNNWQSMFFTIEDQLNAKHPLYILADIINWEVFEDRFGALYSQDNGCPFVPSPSQPTHNCRQEGLLEW